ncbi:hypothetical protein B0H19DRAFT_1084443 [Mycena capillaripes]|nr:hypothetical protein B0H19DRAFT_1084443 [Mycena capillaripes]
MARPEGAGKKEQPGEGGQKKRKPSTDVYEAEGTGESREGTDKNPPYPPLARNEWGRDNGRQRERVRIGGQQPRRTERGKHAQDARAQRIASTALSVASQRRPDQEALEAEENGAAWPQDCVKGGDGAKKEDKHAPSGA